MLTFRYYIMLSGRIEEGPNAGKNVDQFEVNNSAWESAQGIAACAIYAEGLVHKRQFTGQVDVIAEVTGKAPGKQRAKTTRTIVARYSNETPTNNHSDPFAEPIAGLSLGGTASDDKQNDPETQPAAGRKRKGA